MKLGGGRRMALLGLVAGVALSGGLIFLKVSSGPEAPVVVPEPSAGQHGVMLSLDDRVINLRTGGAFKYAKIGLTVELRPENASFYSLAGKERSTVEKEILAEQQANVPLLIDALGTAVSAADPVALLTPEGRVALKEKLLHTFRDLLGEEEVLDIYFTDFVMQ